MPEATVVVRVDEGLKTAFAEAARASDRTTSQLLRDFMRDYVRRQAEQADYDAWLAGKIEASRAAMREGRLHSSEEVEAYFAERRAAARSKPDGKAGD